MCCLLQILNVRVQSTRIVVSVLVMYVGMCKLRDTHWLLQISCGCTSWRGCGGLCVYQLKMVWIVFGENPYEFDVAGTSRQLSQSRAWFGHRKPRPNYRSEGLGLVQLTAFGSAVVPRLWVTHRSRFWNHHVYKNPAGTAIVPALFCTFFYGTTVDF